MIYDNIYLYIWEILYPSPRDSEGLLIKLKTLGNLEVKRPIQLSPEDFIMAHLLMYWRWSVYKISVESETEKENRTAVIRREKRQKFRQCHES